MARLRRAGRRLAGPEPAAVLPQRRRVRHDAAGGGRGRQLQQLPDAQLVRRARVAAGPHRAQRVDAAVGAPRAACCAATSSSSRRAPRARSTRSCSTTPTARCGAARATTARTTASPGSPRSPCRRACCCRSRSSRDSGSRQTVPRLPPARGRRGAFGTGPRACAHRRHRRLDRRRGRRGPAGAARCSGTSPGDCTSGRDVPCDGRRAGSTAPTRRRSASASFRRAGGGSLCTSPPASTTPCGASTPATVRQRT